ncbi:MAG: hypothetical protein Kow0075_12240 [Salibacteraceae bacterium]
MLAANQFFKRAALSLSLLVALLHAAAAQSDLSQSGDSSYVPATFPGGNDALFKHISMITVYPQEAVVEGIDGIVIVQFVINEEGRVVQDSTRIIRSAHPLLDAEATRVVNSLEGWKPALVDGKPVASIYRIPMVFRLTKKEIKKARRAQKKNGDNQR